MKTGNHTCHTAASEPAPATVAVHPVRPSGRAFYSRMAAAVAVQRPRLPVRAKGAGVASAISAGRTARCAWSACRTS